MKPTPITDVYFYGFPFLNTNLIEDWLADFREKNDYYIFDHDISTYLSTLFIHSILIRDPDVMKASILWWLRLIASTMEPFKPIPAQVAVVTGFNVDQACWMQSM